MRYQSRPVVIEATQWWKNGDHPLDRVGEQVREPTSDARADKFYTRQEGAIVRYFRHPAPEFCGECHCEDCGRKFHDHGWIDTAQGGHKVCPGDFVINEAFAEGKFYPCKPDVFISRYEPEQPARTDLPEIREVGDQRILGGSPLGIGVSRR